MLLELLLADVDMATEVSGVAPMTFHARKVLRSTVTLTNVNGICSQPLDTTAMERLVLPPTEVPKTIRSPSITVTGLPRSSTNPVRE